MGWMVSVRFMLKAKVRRSSGIKPVRLPTKRPINGGKENEQGIHTVFTYTEDPFFGIWYIG